MTPDSHLHHSKLVAKVEQLYGDGKHFRAWLVEVYISLNIRLARDKESDRG